jgi:hypothetical protein
MNLPSPIQDETYSKWDKSLLLSIQTFSSRSMRKGVGEAIATTNGTELMVSGDGSWQTRGFQSKNGAAAILSCNTTPKVLDIETCSKTCNICMGKFLFFLFSSSHLLFQGALSIKKSNPAKYNVIIKAHRCEKNYEKSSGSIESDAIYNMFKRSVSKYGIYYTKYVGDGDSKTFAILSKMSPYPGII